jgi:hypothetical protein
MANRFTKGGVENSGKPEVDVQTAAASMQMFGKLTRTVETWVPLPLVCKRFNIKNPFAGKETPAGKQTAELLSGIAHKHLV